MAYKSMMDCVRELERHDHLLRIKDTVDPYLEMAEIHRRVYAERGPALFFEKVKGSPFPAVSNIYGTVERTEFMFRHTLHRVKKLISIKSDPTTLLRRPFAHTSVPVTALTALPKKLSRGSILHGTTTIDQLPQIVSWPDDGGAFVTLPQVFTLPPGSQKIMESNLGMYRIQLSGNDYIQNEEVGMHYQIHRGIGVHHTMYNNSDEPFRASIFIGGPPSHAFSAIMPLPEGLSELTFAGMLGGRRFRYIQKEGHILSADADFCITGTILKNVKKPEGPFGDHLGYYSLKHDFPVMKVDKVYHRKEAVWHFTVVGRPPQEDSSFGYLIHQLVKPLTTSEFPGVKELHAVDAAGVHPLMLAIGSERYMPFRERKPEEILIQANHILGKGQTSLAKFLIIAAEGDAPDLQTRNIPHFFKHVLERVDWKRDLHFQTMTTIDTLDYSGSGWNAGSKVVIASCGPSIRTLSNHIPDRLELPTGFSDPTIYHKGILIIKGPAFNNYENPGIEDLLNSIDPELVDSIPLIVVADDPAFVTAKENNFLWTTFTRANPSHDIYGVNSGIEFKHWGCKGPLVIDARLKPHHAPPLIRDPEAIRKADRFFTRDAVLGKWG